MQRKRNETHSNTPLSFDDFMNRPFAIGCVLMVAHELCGGFTMCSYASIIFAKSGSKMSPTVSSIIVGAIQFLGSYVSTVLVDRLGRKVSKCFQYLLFSIFGHNRKLNKTITFLPFFSF